MDARTLYMQKKELRVRELQAHDSRFRMVGSLRLVCVLLVLAPVIAMVFAQAPSWLWAVTASGALGFVALVILHGRIDRARTRARSALTYCDRGLARLEGDFSGSRTGEGFATDDHPYASDLDLFGRSSLFQRVSVAETRFGEQTLASWLSAPPADAGVVRERQEAALELAKLPDVRERLGVLGATLGHANDPSPMLAWIETDTGRVPHSAWRVLVFVMPIVVLGALFAGPRLGLSATMSSLPYVLAVIVALLMRGRTAPALAAVASREGGLSAYGELFALVEDAELTAPFTKRVKDRLKAGDHQATREMKRLGSIVGFADGLSNEVFRLLIAPVFGYEPRAVLALSDWRKRNAKSVRDWLAALGEIEALASFATMAFEDPALSQPEITAELCFEAEALGHPLLPRGKRKDNDISLEGPSCALVITGSNMSGKSTLMRAMGANAVLALSGAPVCAKKLRVGLLRVATSMRVADSLSESTSRFYAELKKLKLVVDMAKQGPGVFFLLDEILHGTNSRERLIGARALIRDLLSMGALGAVSTHDLGLAELEKELPGKATNVHFQEQVEGEVMTFDYELRAGVVQSSNALRLMKIVGLNVTEE